MRHRRVEVLRAISRQAEKYLHVAFQVTPYEPYVMVAKKLTEVMPGNFEKKALLVNSGTEAVENAIRIVKTFTNRQGLIHFHNSFHGRSLLTTALTGRARPYKRRMGPFPPGIIQAPYAYCYRCPLGHEYPNCDIYCIEYLKLILTTQIAPEDVAAIIVEPRQGDGVLYFHQKNFSDG